MSTAPALAEQQPGALWTASIPFKIGFAEIGARMTVVRLPSGGLLLTSPVTLSAQLRAELDALGPVEAIVASNNMHYLDLDEAARHYPQARCLAPAGVEKKLKTRVEALSATSPAPWDGALEAHHFQGSAYLDEVVFFHRESRTLIVTDLCFNLAPRKSLPGLLTSALLGMKTRPGPSRLLRASIRDHKAGQASIRAILAWEFDRIIVTHGEVVNSGGHEKFRAAWQWLLQK